MTYLFVFEYFFLDFKFSHSKVAIVTVRDVEHEVRVLNREAEIRHDPFVEDFNMMLAEPHSKSVRLNGLATCLRLEKVYWNVLSGIANSNECSVNTVLSYIDREVHLRYGGVKNFSGLIRVVCVAHLLKADPVNISHA